MSGVTIIHGDCLVELARLPRGSAQSCITSPPYFQQRDYNVKGQIGLESEPEQYIAKMVQVFREVRRVLRDDGTLWLNLGDKFRDKQLLGIPWRVALALQADGWVLRSDVVWHKPNAMPNSQQDRPITNHEYIFLFSKGREYFYDDVAIRERSTWNGESDNKNYRSTAQGGDRLDGNMNTLARWMPGFANKRSVWSVPVACEDGAHFAVFPSRLILPCILAGTSEKGACAQCGAPWRREVERTRYATRPGLTTKTTGGTLVDGNRDLGRHCTEVRTIGWVPACTCGTTEVKPCVVLDPFSGSGVTAATAIRKGRDAIGIELNPDYVEMSKRKVALALEAQGFGF